MIRRYARLLRASLAIADALVVLGLFWLISDLRLGANWVRVWLNLMPESLMPDETIYFVPLLLAAGWVVVLWSRGLYRLRTRWSFMAMAVEMVPALAIMVVAVFALFFLFKMPDVSRVLLVTLLPSIALGSLALRALIELILVLRRRRGGNVRNMLIVGSGPTAIRFGRELEAQPMIGMKVVGYLDGVANAPSMGWAYLGSYGDLPRVLHERVIDEVAICLDLAEWSLIKEIVELCKAEGKIARIPLAGSILGEGRHYVEVLSDMAVLSVMQGPDRQVALAIKRALDVVASAVGLLISAPVMLVCAAAILVESGRPVIFSQERVGLHGRPFFIYKFRTMVKGAEELLPELQPLNQIKGHAFKIQDDPRITRVGRVLRKTSLDELPQLWNVFRGSMSLIGPRPPIPGEVQEYDIWHRRRLSMKPGITGLWQVQARREHDFDRWVEKDLEYIDGWSLRLDARIAMRTLPAMIRFEGR
jgi:exopolysaccharide biosynthesis polyprenyl glycosylphosphotransferase